MAMVDVDDSSPAFDLSEVWEV